MTREGISSNLVQKWLTSNRGELEIISNNIFKKSMQPVRVFFKTFNFNIPTWLSSSTTTTSTSFNKITFNPNTNIDAEWVEIFQKRKDVEFHLMSIHLSIFQQVVDIIRNNYNNCTLLKYGCMCDKYGIDHAHFILVVRNTISDVFDDETIAILNGSEMCALHMKKFRTTRINKSYELYRTIQSLGSRFDCNSNIVDNEIVRPYTRQSSANMYEGSHWHIFRPTHPFTFASFMAIETGNINLVKELLV